MCIYLKTWLIFVVLILYCACSYMHCWYCSANCVGSVKQPVRTACDHRDHLLRHLLKWPLMAVMRRMTMLVIVMILMMMYFVFNNEFNSRNVKEKQQNNSAWDSQDPQKWLCNLWTLLKTWFIISKSELIRMQRAKKYCHPTVLCGLKSMILMILWSLIEQCVLLCYEWYPLSVSPGYAVWYPEYSYQTMDSTHRLCVNYEC